MQRLAVRGAPALGVAGALGVLLAGADAAAAERIAAARPTAVNLRWAVQRVLAADDREAEALAILEEDVAACAAIGAHGREELSGATAVLTGCHAGRRATAGGAAGAGGGMGARGGEERSGATAVLTVCNAGRLATAGIGTALAPVYAKAQAGEPIAVFACETRPLLQGARLTAWELADAGIPVTVLPDAAAPSLLAGGGIDAVIVGCDRVAANGDVANKIGTYALAVAARHHGVPFYVAGPRSTLDPLTPTGAEIVIEERDGAEVRAVAGLDVSTAVWNPAFDVPPAELITGLITDAGVLRAPYGPAIASVVA